MAVPFVPMVYRGVSGPFTYKGSYFLYPTGGGTLITWTLEGDTQGFFGMAEPVLSKMAEMKLEADLEKIKAVLESDGVASLEYYGP
ncbi:MAG: SRPBCC family protein [Bacteroidota bacterium]